MENCHIFFNFLQFPSKQTEKKERCEMGIEGLRKKNYILKSLECIGHGNIGHVGWDLVLLAESLKLLPCKAVEIHRERVCVCFLVCKRYCYFV